MLYHCDKALTNNEESKSHSVSSESTPSADTEGVVSSLHTQTSMETGLTGTFIKVEFTVVTKESR